MAEKTHQVAITVFCEAAGVDYHDAASAAAMALRQTFRDNDVKAREALPEANEPACNACGLRMALTAKGKVRSHIPGEPFAPRSAKDRCAGAGQNPRVPEEPVIAFTHRNGVKILARVHEVMETGTAAGNGYLWTKPTGRGFR